MKRFMTALATVFALGLALPFMLAGASAVKDNFWNEAATGGLAEVAMARLALERSQNDSVKQFAQRMIDDHTAANSELMSLAASKNVTLPTALEKDDQAFMTKLGGKSGANFDRDYMKAQVKDHEEAVKLFQKESQKGTDADVKAWAAKTLPTLQSHLDMARSISASLGGTSDGHHMDHNSNMDHNMNSDANMNSNHNMNSNRKSNSNRRSNSNSNSNMNMNR